MDSIKYYLAISAACAFTMTPCSAKEAIGNAVLTPPETAAATPVVAPAVAPAAAAEASAR
ncbi:MAG: hypothetical protein J0H69_16340 [Burkholderiales bacterium]|jgi:hypothetical protein|nr:hypothetical protein [Burkholderiales bacterium]